ncbi:Uu.00g003780.m01.CDS01 [Anthostomella pinea]|uniref:Uu.00g003780.m01.CDS01 n=1 Tax=Anthostomella pinea TaxID=933095 RepID=A0AAI8VEH7_9PEZI|nr:Uu.00g003780.m01.CDS01 [Anthostomella pinea]
MGKPQRTPAAKFDEIPGELPHGTRTWLEGFDGCGHPDVAVTAATSNGGENLNDDYDAIVVGGGQAGLFTTGRLKALGVRYVLLERRPEIGHVWATRYESLRWHTSKHYGALPFGHTYPEEDDYMLPAKRIGAGHKAWVEKHGINVRTSTSVDSATWDEATSTWTVVASSPDGQHTMTAKNLVLAIGPGHLTPSRPDWAVPDKVAASGFKGTVLHGSEYKSSLAWSGQRGVVVGTANTGHDVAEDMANAGMQTTMVQRGATFVFPAEWLHSSEDVMYNATIDPTQADREAFTYANKIMREIINRGVWKGIAGSPERFDDLEKAGFKVERYGDIYNNLYVRFGGHYVDIGASARIAKGEIKVKAQSVKALTKDGLLFDDGSEVPADLLVLATGFDHDFRNDAANVVGVDVANQMDDFWGVDREGEIIGHAKLAGLEYFQVVNQTVAFMDLRLPVCRPTLVLSRRRHTHGTFLFEIYCIADTG